MSSVDAPKRRYGNGESVPVAAPQPRRILTPAEAIPLLLDGKISPIVSLDTEFGERGKDVPACRARLNGMSLGGGTPETGHFATFFPFDNSSNMVPWAQVRDRVIFPIITDPSRGVVMHPLKTDMQVIGQPARGIPRSAFKCRLYCTMSMVHIFDENLPKGLKELGDCLLGVNDLASYKQVQREMDSIRKEGAKEVKAALKQAWAVYREWRAKSPVAEAPIDRSWPLWQQLAMQLPSNKLLPKEQRLLAKDVAARLEPKLNEGILGGYLRRAADRFALYGAEDALLTLEVFYYLAARIQPDMWWQVEFERQVCHPIVTEMEELGLKIDVPRLAAIRNAMETAVKIARADVIARFGFLPTGEKTIETEDEDTEFNPASNDQIAQVIWNVWKLRPPTFAIKNGSLIPKFRRAKDGLCSTDKEVRAWLEKNAPEPYAGHVKRLTEMSRLEKLLSNFVVPIFELAQDDPNQRLHAGFWPVGARTGRFTSCVSAGTPIEVLRDVAKNPRGVAIEDVRAGDYVYSYTDDSPPRLTIKRVTWAGKTGRRSVVRVHWRGQGGKHSGYLDITPEHRVRLVSGDYRRADDLVSGDRVLALSRGVHSRYGYARVWAANEAEIAREHRWIYETLNGPVPQEDHVHHKDENKLNNHPDNLEQRFGPDHLSEHARKMWADPERRRAQAETTRQRWRDGLMTPTPSGAANPNFQPLDRDWLEAVLWEHGGKPTALRDVYGLDYECAIRKVREHDIDWRAIKLMHRPDGSFISRADVDAARRMRQEDALRELGKNFYSFRKLQEAYDFDPWNHIIDHVEVLDGEVDVYDLTIADTNNFIAGEVDVHNSDPNAENIPKANTMPTLPIPEGVEYINPPPGVVCSTEKKAGNTEKVWRVESLRRIFIAEPGVNMYAVADLAQIENRIIGHESQDPALLELFRRWDCFECKGTGLTNEPLHACPQCKAPDGKRDKSKPDQPALKGFCLGKDIHSHSGYALGFVEKYGPSVGRDRAKCISLNSLVQTTDGLSRLADYVDETSEPGSFVPAEGLFTLTPPNKYGTRTGRVQDLVYSGLKSSVVVVSKRGVLRCSEDHPVTLASGECVRAADLQVGAALMPVDVLTEWRGERQTIRVNPFGDGSKYAMGPDVDPSGPCEMELDARWAYFAGVVAGDGCASGGDGFSISVGKGDEFQAWREVVEGCCRDLRLPTKPAKKKDSIRIGSRRVGRFLRQLGMSGKWSKRLAIPDWVLRGPEGNAWAYLAGVIDTDGTISTANAVSITSKHAEFIGELAFMARVLGLLVNVECCWNKTYSRWYFRLHFLAGGLRRLCEKTPLRSEKAAKLQQRAAKTRGAYPLKPDEVKLVLRVGEVGSDIRGRAASPLYVPDMDPIPMGDFSLATDDHLYAPMGLATHNTFNHAFSYGMQEYTLARREGIEPEEARAMLEIMRRTYPGIPQLQWRVRREIEATGQVRLFDGHLRRFPIQKLLRDSGNFMDWEWEGTIREGTNVLAQGGTGILMKRAMIRLDQRFKSEPELSTARIVSQIHDELILEARKDQVKYALAVMVWELEHAAPELCVPVIAEGHTGSNWAEAK